MWLFVLCVELCYVVKTFLRPVSGGLMFNFGRCVPARGFFRVWVFLRPFVSSFLTLAASKGGRGGPRSRSPNVQHGSCCPVVVGYCPPFRGALGGYMSLKRHSCKAYFEGTVCPCGRGSLGPSTSLLLDVTGRSDPKTSVLRVTRGSRGCILPPPRVYGL